MTIQTFVGAVARESLENVEALLHGLAHPPVNVSNPEHVAAGEFVRGLSPEQLSSLRYLLKVNAVDTVSTVLGALDGVTSVDNQYFRLTVTDEQGQVLSGDLQEAFLQHVEDTSVTGHTR